MRISATTSDVDMPAPPADETPGAGDDSMDVDPLAVSSSATTILPPSLPPTSTGGPNNGKRIAAPLASSADATSPWPQGRLWSHVQTTRHSDLGCHFDALLAAWTRIELGTGSTLGEGNATADLAIPDHAAYAEGWQAWWDSLQPIWRKRAKDGNWSTEGGYGKDGTDWGPLYQWGVNGMLNIVASLYFWGCSLVSGDLRGDLRWETAVIDVTWMMEGMAVYYERFNRKF
ncbi:hypothetical protein C8R47DRAFT_1206903 [Mycena vitilis]|nr:hypothetical protein C8R47DRAFT_1206903 [Mycena vitilis]